MCAAWKPRAVSFSSGGVRLIGQMGTLARLQEEGVLDEVVHWYGCSGGCIPAFIGAMGGSPAWIADIVRLMELWQFMQYDAASISEFPTHWGVCQGSELLQFMCDLIDTWHPGSSAWTFADFAREIPGVGLTFIATNVTQGRQELLGVDHTPDMRIMDGIRASMAIPLFFTPSWLPSGDCLCDGSVLEYFPWACVPNKKETLVVLNDDFLVPGRSARAAAAPKSLGSYIAQIMYVSLQKSKNVEPPRFWIAVNDTTSFLDFNIPLERRVELFEQGRTAAARWLAFRLSKTSAAAETGGSHPSSAGPCTSDADPPSQNRTSGSHPAHSPPQPPYPSRGLSPAARRPARRWSL